MFSFDDKYSMFDVTPVANQFILEYLPQAKGDYVKVWLYGLARCFIPGEDMTLEKISTELGMETDDIQAAFRYWERRGLVQRISDQPPAYRYVNVLEHMFSGAHQVDPEYENFAESLYQAFGNDRELHGAEIRTFFEWKEELKLPSEVIIMVIRHLISTKGKHFTMKSAEKLVSLLVDEEARTIEAAEVVLSRNLEVYNGTKKILKTLNFRRYPTEPELDLYRKWHQDWNFNQDAIEKACEETVKSGNPSFGYLDGILKRIHEKSGSITVSEMEKKQKLHAEVNDFLYILGAGSATEEMTGLYQKFLSLYPKEVIQLAARTCARKSGSPEDVSRLLDSWKKRGLRTEGEIRAWITKVDEQNSFLRELREKWGMRGAVAAADRELLDKWQNTWGFTRDLIRHASSYATGTDKPILYLDRILSTYYEKGIHTQEEAEKDHQTRKVSKEAWTNPAANFSQRKWEDDPDEMERFMAGPITLKEDGSNA